MSNKFDVVPLPYDYNSMKGISEQVMKWHHDKHYASYVAGRNAAGEELAKMRDSGDFGGIRAALEAQSFHQSGQVLHELFFDILGGDGKAGGELAVVQQIESDFGSFDTWQREFSEAAKQSRGWVLLLFDPKSGRLHNSLVDFHHLNALWGVTLVMCIDMWEHAFYYDYGPDKVEYIKAFLNNVNWEKVNDLFEKNL